MLVYPGVYTGVYTYDINIYIYVILYIYVVHYTYIKHHICIAIWCIYYIYNHIYHICIAIYIYYSHILCIYIYNHITIFMVYLLAIRTHPPDQPADGQGTQQSQPFRGSEGSNVFFTTEWGVFTSKNGDFV